MFVATKATGSIIRSMGHGVWVPAPRAQVRTRPGRQVWLPLPLRPADHAFGDQRVDLASGVAELAEHFGGMRGKFRRDAAQARFGPLHPDRRGDALVPVLCDDIAAMDGMRVVQRLVDLLHGPR